MTRITVYEIEGELLTRKEIHERCPGVSEKLLAARLGRGNRTWVNLRITSSDAVKRSRDRMRKQMSVERQTSEHMRKNSCAARNAAEAGIPRNLDGTEASDRRNPRARKSRF